MAITIAKYKFSTKEHMEGAKKQLSSRVSSGFYGYTSSSNGTPFIEIYEDCRDITAASQICTANGGIPQ
jgi:hypothetical protein